jgi:DNA mismatch repair protein MutS
VINLEQEIFYNICSKILEHDVNLRKLAHILNLIDVFSSFARLAKEYGYTKPQIVDDENIFEVIDGRHPVLEKELTAGKFIPNTCSIDDNQKLLIITGPNMAGKSTFLRQNAVIAIMAHIGSFVPAAHAKIGLIDKIFSRIGASDDLASGLSTFMMEMTETSSILAQATSKSFIIMDEIGRGTATYDGIAIAAGVLEYIHDNIKCRSLFATHYHELYSLVQLPFLKSYNMAIFEENEEVIFLHKVVEGIADKSYGIHVASIAGLPDSLISRAKNILNSLEIEKAHLKTTNISNNKCLICREVLQLNPDELSAKKALELIYKLHRHLSCVS